MCAGNGDGVFELTGDKAEQLRALNERQLLLPCGDKLGIVLADGGGVHHHVRTLDVFGSMSHVHRDAERADAL